MAQFKINPATVINASVSFTPTADILINAIENTHALELDFSVNDTIRANTEVKVAEKYASTGFTPEVVVNYTEI